MRIFKTIMVFFCVLFLYQADAFAGYLEPLGGGQTYGCEPGTKSVFKHNDDGTNSRLKTGKVNALIAKYKNDKKKKKLYTDLKACVEGKLKFRNPCAVIGAGKAASIGANVINGRMCAGNSPSVVKVTIRAENGSSGNCSGVVVHPKIVLTSAHCFTKLGDSYLYEGIVTLPDGSTYTSEVTGFRGDFANPPVYDVGYIAFHDALPGVEAIPLIGKSESVPAGSPAVIAGFGYAEDQNTGDLIAGYTRIKSSDEFSITTTFSGFPGESGTCYGDSGGPLLLWTGGQWKLLGLTSTSSDLNCNPNAELYFTYVREADAEDMMADSACYRFDGYGAPSGECPFEFKQ